MSSPSAQADRHPRLTRSRPSRWPVLLTSAILLLTIPAFSQANSGELRLKITDPSGAAVHTTVRLLSTANGYDKTIASDDSGNLAIHGTPFGVYQLLVQQPGFAPFTETLQIRSALPLTQSIHLTLPSVNIDVDVKGAEAPSTANLIDLQSASSVMRIDSRQIEQRVSSIPGRSVQDLVDSQPGWLYEGNAVLHPRGAEYQTQFVIDGIPLTDNRSPSFGPEIEADDLDSISLYTAGFPAEYGRKMGGVVELTTQRQTDPGLHGQFVFSGGSYNSATGFAQLQQMRGKNTLGLSASGAMTSHYLNPVVPENYTNQGTTADFASRYERNLPGSDHLSLSLRHELARFLVPNELVQQQAGQRQNGDNFETIGTLNYQHILSPNSLLALAAMGRNNASDLESNHNPTPIAAFLHNHFNEGYLKATFSLHHGHQELKAGIESDTLFLHQNFNYTITDATQFDPGTPASLSFAAQRPDIEQAAFVQDSMQLGQWILNAGLRWDHYQLLVNQNAFSPRISLGRALPSLKMVLHASYDRVFQTPSSDNILISGSPSIDALSSQFLRRPVQPSLGNSFEAGLAESLLDRIRLDVNFYRRNSSNYADDDQLLNTGVSYPIAFSKAVIYGAEGKLEILRLRRLNGFASYSWMLGNVCFPVTGGLFLGPDASNALANFSGHFPDSQDQRNTLRTRYRYQLAPRLWFAAGAAYGSGLPFEFDGTQQAALAQYGPAVISRLNFARGRVRPQLALNSSLGIDILQREKAKIHLQFDGENLNNRLNVIDFGGLFSGNAIGPARSFNVRLNTSF